MSLALVLLLTMSISSCQESLEKRAAREAAEFTQKSCPTPERDNTITDSMLFDIPTHTFIHYYRLTGPADNAERMVGREGELHNVLVNAVRNNMSIKRYKDAGYTFRYVYRSQKDGNVLFDTTVKPEEYQ
jgi:hypothetical protein